MDSIILNCSQIDKSSTETSSTLQNPSYNSSKNSKSSPQTPKSLYPTPPTQPPVDVTIVLTFCSTKCNTSPLSPWMPISTAYQMLKYFDLSTSYGTTRTHHDYSLNIKVNST